MYVDMDEWAEMHGYVNHCLACGQLTDSDFCSGRCAIAYRDQDENGDEEENE